MMALAVTQWRRQFYATVCSTCIMQQLNTNCHTCITRRLQNKTHPFEWLILEKREKDERGNVKVTEYHKFPGGLNEMKIGKSVIFLFDLSPCLSCFSLLKKHNFTTQYINMTDGFILLLSFVFWMCKMPWKNRWNLSFKQYFPSDFPWVKWSRSSQDSVKIELVIFWCLELLQSIIYFFVASLSEFRLVVWVESLRMTLRSFSCIQMSCHCSLQSYVFWLVDKTFSIFYRRNFNCYQVFQPRESETIHNFKHCQHR